MFYLATKMLNFLVLSVKSFKEKCECWGILIYDLTSQRGTFSWQKFYKGHVFLSSSEYCKLIFDFPIGEANIFPQSWYSKSIFLSLSLRVAKKYWRVPSDVFAIACILIRWLPVRQAFRLPFATPFLLEVTAWFIFPSSTLMGNA